MVFVLTLFIVILLRSRTVNENISTGAVIRANSGTETAFVNYWRTSIKPVSVTSLGP